MNFVGLNGSCFGGKGYELVVSVGQAGNIGNVLIWHRESGELLRRISTFSQIECVAWNHSRDYPFMFATGHSNGSVRIFVEQPEFEAENMRPMDSSMQQRGSGEESTSPCEAIYGLASTSVRV